MEKTNLGLVEFAKKARDMKAGYVYGTFGEVLTKSLLEYKRKQYPYQIEKYYDFIKTHYLGKITYDCVGLFKAYLWSNQNGVIVYDSATDLSANGMFNVAKVKGPINTMPDIPGLGVRYDQHIAVYIGNGKVIEAKGTQSGVVETDLNKRPWSHWLEFPYITYIKEDKNKEMKKGEKGENVNFLQTLLNINGASLAVDSSFGGKTEAAVIEYQTKIGLPANGIVDFTTLCRLGEDAMSKCINQYEQINTKLIKIQTAYKNMGTLFN
jgi:hypothetical protein